MESEMTAYDVDNEKWNEGLTDLVNTDSGVKLNFSVPREYFQSISNNATGARNAARDRGASLPPDQIPSYEK